MIEAESVTFSWRMQVKYVATLELEQEGPGVAFSALKLEHLVELVLNRPPHIHIHTNTYILHHTYYNTHTILPHNAMHTSSTTHTSSTIESQSDVH